MGFQYSKTTADLFYVRSQAAVQTESMRLESAERVFNIPAQQSSDGMAKVVYQVPAADVYSIDPDRSTLSLDSEALEGRLSTGYPTDSWTN